MEAQGSRVSQIFLLLTFVTFVVSAAEDTGSKISVESLASGAFHKAPRGRSHETPRFKALLRVEDETAPSPSSLKEMHIVEGSRRVSQGLQPEPAEVVITPAPGEAAAAPAAEAEVINQIETRADKGPNTLGIAFGLGALVFICYVGNAKYTQMQAPAAAGAAAEGEGAGTDAAAGAPLTEDQEELPLIDISEDVYGVTLACMVRDLQMLAKESKHQGIRWARIFISCGLAFFNMLIQVALLMCIARLSCAKAVHDIREAYSGFEKHMYNNEVYLNGNGNARGLDDKFFQPERFATLDDEVKEGVCRIPFSQPDIIFVALFVWALMIVGEFKQTLNMFERMVMHTESAETMADATEKDRDGNDVIKRLTKPVKAFITFFLIIPRMFISCWLLWLGCRWLAATNDFQNLVLNAVGLEFLLLLKELVYQTLATDRNKRDAQKMKIDISFEENVPSPMTFLGTVMWGVVAFAWVYLYIYSFQAVLPGYRWDVRKVCEEWMKENFDQE